MNDKETILMLEAQIRRFQELLKDPEARIKEITKQKDREIDKLERRVIELQRQLFLSLDTLSEKAIDERRLARLVADEIESRKDSGGALGFLDMGGPA